MAGVKGRPTKLDDDVRSVIGRIHIRHPNWSIREIEKKFPEFCPELKGRAPGRSTIANFIAKEIKPNEALIEEAGTDKPWSTATLDNEPISPEAIPMLLFTQHLLKEYLSKPLTIRETKWLSRFNGIYGRGNTLLPLEDVDENTKRTVKALIIVTWAKIYAHREKIDAIAGIKEPDYSDFDDAIASNDLDKVFDDNTKQFRARFIAIDKQTGTFEERQTRVGKEINKLFQLHPNTEAIMIAEYHRLGFSLGTPDMPDEATYLYLKMLAKNANDKQLLADIDKLTLLECINLMVELRLFCKENYQQYRTEIKVGEIK